MYWYDGETANGEVGEDGKLWYFGFVLALGGKDIESGVPGRY